MFDHCGNNPNSQSTWLVAGDCRSKTETFHFSFPQQDVSVWERMSEKRLGQVQEMAKVEKTQSPQLYPLVGSHQFPKLRKLSRGSPSCSSTCRFPAVSPAMNLLRCLPGCFPPSPEGWFSLWTFLSQGSVCSSGRQSFWHTDPLCPCCQSCGTPETGPCQVFVTWWCPSWANSALLQELMVCSHGN